MAPNETTNNLDAKHAEGRELRMEPSDHKEIQHINGDLSKTNRIGTPMTEWSEKEMIMFLRKNVDVFAWSRSDFQGISLEGYHQIFMAEEGQEKISSVTEKGVYYYRIMPFGLKNGGATYQRLINKIF
ncbi:hypothetical protein Sango_2016900 [Sesamum angolense]|uniref:Uncharacterized protein n=1 Tax=Sesamum angolense TaxID=2727404 RepID=A0AAE2BNW5_9LAMI|nr:hypothetical protein Sango_2016900 [Sesamum angolense]